MQNSEAFCYWPSQGVLFWATQKLSVHVRRQRIAEEKIKREKIKRKGVRFKLIFFVVPRFVCRFLFVGVLLNIFA